jgi:type 1 glutamine amidotransferase
MKNHLIRGWLKPAVGLALISGLAVSGWAQSPKHVLLVSVTKGFRHDVIPTTDDVIADLGKKSGKFDVDYVKTDEDMAAKMSAEGLQKYDGVIFNNTTGDLPLPDRQAFLDYIKAGHGFAGFHAATDTYPNFPAYTEMIGAHFLTHQEQVEVKIYNQDRFHGATRNLDEILRVFDEIYIVKDFNRDQVHGLLTLDKHPNSGVPGEYPIAWCKYYGQGRVFYTSLGHRVDVVKRPDVLTHYLNGILWSLGMADGSATPQTLTAYSVSSDEKELGYKPLFNGRDMTGWKLRRQDGAKTWSVQDNMLVNVVPDKQHGTDLVTDEKYWNFTVRYEYMIPKGANSGFYLRGRYEVQILDDGDDTKPSMSSNGSIYNFAVPSQYACLKAGEWNQVEATIVENKVTVVLNGVKIHDNIAVNRPTGSEIDGKVNEPGPLFLQGDHGSVAFRNLRIRTLK